MAKLSITLGILGSTGSTGSTTRLLGRALIVFGLGLDLDAELSNLLIDVVFVRGGDNGLLALSRGLGGRGLVIVLAVGVRGDGGLLALGGGLAGGSLLLGGRAARGGRSGGTGARGKAFVVLADLGEVLGKGLSGGLVAERLGWDALASRSARVRRKEVSSELQENKRIEWDKNNA